MGRVFKSGDIVAGKYRVERILGEGGHGVVLGARNITLDEPVAIKVVKSEAMENPEAVARFLREAKAAVRMRGEHVARVLDVGSLEDGTPYMLMEQLEGADLATIVEKGGVLPIATAIDYVLQACEALAEAHALGIVHRDVKPANLFLTHRVDGTPCVKVLDFGISKATHAIDATRPDFGLTQTQTIMGSPQYMAPEQMRSSRRVDGRTDIWALGTSLHELLTGQPPFSASTMPELFAIILEDEAPSLRVLRPDVPPELDAVVARCLAKKPEGRPASVIEVAKLLGPFAGSLSAGMTERIGRVAQNVAATSQSNLESLMAATPITASTASTASAASAAKPSVTASARDSASAPELAHATTTSGGVLPQPRRFPRWLLPGVVTLALASVLLAALVIVRARKNATASASVGIVSAPRELPPSATAVPEVPPTKAPSGAPSPDAPPATATTEAASPPSAEAAAPSPPHVGKPGTRPPVRNPTRPAASSGKSAEPPTPPAPTPAKPAPTASSRYD